MQTKIYDLQTAEMVIDNVKTDILQGLEAGARKGKTGRYYSSGVSGEFNDIIDGFLKEYDKRVVGTALDIVRSHFDFTNPALYYPAREGTEAEIEQGEEVQRFENMLEKFIQRVQRDLEEEAQDPYNSDNELTDEEIREYNRLRKNIQNRLSYYKMKGIHDLPELPALEELGHRSRRDIFNILDYLEDTGMAKFTSTMWIR